MNKLMWDIEIKLTLPSSSLVSLPKTENNSYLENPSFKSIRDYLGIEININNWYNRCMQIPYGKKHLQRIELYYTNDENSYILLDNYSDPYDQLGLIRIGIKTTAKLGFELRKLTRILNDECKFNINYSEGSNSVFKLYPIDEKSQKRYPESQKSEYLIDKNIVIIKPDGIK